jgi:hypothetical protein
VERLGRGVDGVKMKALKKLLKLTAIAFAVLIILFFLSATCAPRATIGRPAKAQIEMVNLAVALKNYESTYGVYPTGENSNIISMLTGDNPQKTVLLNFRRTAENPNEMVDPWEMPYQIQFFQQTNFIIRSAGKDKIFGDADDFTFNSVSNNFVKP